MNDFGIGLQSEEHVRLSEPSVRIHFQRGQELTFYMMRADLLLTSQRIVGSRRFFGKTQITPDIDLERITQIDVVETLKMRGMTRRGSGRFLRLEVTNPKATIAFRLSEELATHWADALKQPPPTT
jgi:hypothetical protein